MSKSSKNCVYCVLHAVFMIGCLSVVMVAVPGLHWPVLTAVAILFITITSCVTFYLGDTVSCKGRQKRELLQPSPDKSLNSRIEDFVKGCFKW